MIDIRKPHHLGRLLIESFFVLGRCWVKLAAVLLLMFLLTGATTLLSVFLPGLFVQFCFWLPMYYLGTTILRIMTKTAENEPEGLLDSFRAALLPTLYMIGFVILMTAVYVVVCFVAGFCAGLVHTKWTGGLILLLFILTVNARLTYAPNAIALCNEGPLEAIIHSWRLSAGSHYITALGTFLAVSFLPLLFLFVVLGGLYILIPTFFANSFDLTNLSPVWISVFVILALVYLLGLAAMPAFCALVFVNQDNVQTRGPEMEPTAEQIRLEQDIAQAVNALGPNAPAAPQPPAFAPNARAEAEVEVTTSSIHITSEAIQQDHLDAVYSPENAKVQEYMQQEEDRMPTILFDEEMAKQMEESRKQWENRNKKENRPQDPDGGSIKISKR